MANSTERLLINLRIIAQMQPFQRINAKEELLGIEPDGWSTPWTRWLRADDRAVCMRRISEIVDECNTLLRKTDTHEKLREKVVKGLDAARPGLRNLRKTYEHDIKTAAHIDLIVDKVTDLAPLADDESDLEDN